METIECGICFECVLEKDLQYLDCIHSLCFKCYRRLLSLTCPFCRAEINLDSEFLNVNKDEDEDIFSFDDSNIFLENDFIISGRNRKTRQENKRKKISKKREQLNNIINESVPSVPILIPNSKIRSNRKNRNETQIFFSSSI
jgi:hypothetical protein